jgi:23S rRNA pseudouridine2457 synthase
MHKHRYFMLHKPFDMVSQFISSHDVNLLGSLNFDFPAGTHAIGRLDKNSEGLLLLTTNNKVTRLLFHGTEAHTRTYCVQVKKIMSPDTVEKLSKGIAISAKNGSQYITQPCEVKLIAPPTFIQNLENTSLHKNVVNSWVSISLTEGKYHQVRKMVATVGHKCLRLIRTSIEGITLENLQPGEVLELSEEYFFEKLRL